MSIFTNSCVQKLVPIEHIKISEKSISNYLKNKVF